MTRNISWLRSVDYWKCAQHVYVRMWIVLSSSNCHYFQMTSWNNTAHSDTFCTRFGVMIYDAFAQIKLSKYAEILLKLVDKGCFLFPVEQLNEIHPVGKRCVLCRDAIEPECNDMQFTCTFNVAFWASVVVVTDAAAAACSSVSE